MELFYYRTSFLKRRKLNDVQNDENILTETLTTRMAKAEAWEGAEGRPAQTTAGAGSTNPWPSRIL
jgi:hypothetical protein